jgi:hypothetical protein
MDVGKGFLKVDLYCSLQNTHVKQGRSEGHWGTAEMVEVADIYLGHFPG